MISGPREIQFELCAQGTDLAFPFLLFFFLMDFGTCTSNPPPSPRKLQSSSTPPTALSVLLLGVGGLVDAKARMEA